MIYVKKGIIETAADLAAPILTSYVAWILIKAQKIGIRRLFFLAREGEILMKVARPLLDFYNLDIDICYLHVSRQSLHLPALDDLSAEDLSSMNIRHPISALRIFAKLEIDNSARFLIQLQRAGYLGPTDDTELNDSELRSLIAALRTEELLSVMRLKADLRKQTLIAYLTSKSFFSDDAIGIVDIGWNGRLQRSLAIVCGQIDSNIKSKLHGFYYSLATEPANSGYFYSYVDVQEKRGIAPYVRPALFEVFCSARHGTTLYYEFGQNGEAHPKLASLDNPSADHWGLEIQQNAIVAFVEGLMSVNQFAQWSLEQLARDLHISAQVAATHIIGKPTRLQAQSLGSFPHAADEPEDGSPEIAPAIPLSPRKWVKRVRRRKRGRPLISNWPEGSMVRGLPTPIGHLAIALYQNITRLRHR